jgi:DNA-binding CsgD family transcriptional regulator
MEAMTRSGDTTAIYQVIAGPSTENWCDVSRARRTNRGGRCSGESPSGTARLIERRHEGGEPPCKPQGSEESQASEEPQAGEEPLSVRERSILRLIGDGKSNKEIAREINVSPETVKSHIKNIFVKLAVERRAHAVSRAHRLGLVGDQ